MKNALEVISHEPEPVYRSKRKDFLSSHQLGDFRKSPLLYWRKKTGAIKDEDRAAFIVGRAAHTLILEGEAEFNAQYCTGGPINPTTGKSYGTDSKKFQDWAIAQGKPCIGDADMELCRNLRVGVKSHSHASRLLANGTAEGVVRARYNNVECQIRMDWFNESVGIVDLKTCNSLDYFEADMKAYGYGNQMAFYRAVLHAACGAWFPVHIIGVEKQQPHRVGVWQASDAELNRCQIENEQAIAALLECSRRNDFPSGFEEKRVF